MFAVLSSLPVPIRIASLFASLLVLVGCAGAGEELPETGILEQEPELVAAGEPLYQENCAACHGADLRGTDRGPSHLSIVYEPNHHGDAAFFLAVRNGVRQHHWPFCDMVPVEGLSDPEIERIVAYVREQQRVAGFEPYPPGA